MVSGAGDVGARLELFGFAPTVARAEVLDRSTSWRATRALLAGGIGVGAAPAVFFLPLHFPWPVLSVGIGFYVARSRWTERHTLLSVSGPCPACGADVRLEKPVRLEEPHVLHCGGCGRPVAMHLR